ncbi:MAG: hypothetical protein IJ112_08700 [Oscillospiraceae bacterium]|nr:hypothetical protein [Oscillospiraceae bacterium]
MKKTAFLALLLSLALLSGCMSEPVDVDLTKLSSTFVYSEVYNMVTNPDDYRGKLVKMDGTMNRYTTTSRELYACLILDATACCAQGIAFEWAGEHAPSEYPPQGSLITVVGTFDTFEEDGVTYCYLANATLK